MGNIDFSYNEIIIYILKSTLIVPSKNEQLYLTTVIDIYLLKI